MVYSEKLSLKALLIMIVRRLHKVHELLSVLQEPTAKILRGLLSEGGLFPTRAPWIDGWAVCPSACLARSRP
ncbi:MAG TPA: hypothetical protein VHG28_18740 [Longimicrobiaceae bacterium]|nr:hypothetical protein [Longimicrobiaceae bacterium]